VAAIRPGHRPAAVPIEATPLPSYDLDHRCVRSLPLVAEHVPQGPTEDHLVEEIAGILWRKRCLSLGWSGGWQWTHDGERIAWIDLRAEAERLHLTYRVRVGGGDWEDVAETVRIEGHVAPVPRRARTEPLSSCRTPAGTDR
jgi:hypothetical protein